MKMITKIAYASMMGLGFEPLSQAVIPAPDGGHRWLQYGGWLPFAQERHNWRLQHGGRRWDAPCQHGKPKYGCRRGSALKQQ